jgi:hypothetical protein
MKVPMNAAAMPTTIVSQIGMCCLPRTTSRPRGPDDQPDHDGADDAADGHF